MGFSLERFFNDLEEIINSKNIFTKLSRLRKVIREGRDYARACGHIQGS